MHNDEVQDNNESNVYMSGQARCQCCKELGHQSH